MRSFRYALKYRVDICQYCASDDVRFETTAKLYATGAVFLAPVHPENSASTVQSRETQEMGGYREAIETEGL